MRCQLERANRRADDRAALRVRGLELGRVEDRDVAVADPEVRGLQIGGSLADAGARNAEHAGIISCEHGDRVKTAIDLERHRIIVNRIRQCIRGRDILHLERSDIGAVAARRIRNRGKVARTQFAALRERRATAPEVHCGFLLEP